jgi:hypothetical protein
MTTQERMLKGDGHPSKLALHPVDLPKIATDVVVAAPLMVGQLESARGVSMAGTRSTEVDHGGQILLLPECDCAGPP